MGDLMWSDCHHMELSLRMRRVTDLSPGAKKWSTFLISLTQFAYSLCHFQGATTKIKPCYRKKIVFSHCEGYKVHCACAVSRDLCTEGPAKPHVTISWSRIIYSLCNFYGATTMTKGSLYWSIPMLKRFSVAKKTVQPKSVTTITIFWKFKGLI